MLHLISIEAPQDDPPRVAVAYRIAIGDGRTRGDWTLCELLTRRLRKLLQQHGELPREPAKTRR